MRGLIGGIGAVTAMAIAEAGDELPAPAPEPQRFSAGDEGEAYAALIAGGLPEPTCRAERRRLKRHVKKALAVKPSTGVHARGL